MCSYPNPGYVNSFKYYDWRIVLPVKKPLLVSRCHREDRPWALNLSSQPTLGSLGLATVMLQTSWLLNWYSMPFTTGFPGSTSGKEPACQCRRHKRHRFNPWVRKIPWRRKWQGTPVFWPGKSRGQRSLVGYSPWSCRGPSCLSPAPCRMMHATWWTLAHFISVGLSQDACWLPKLQPDLSQFSPNTDPKKPLRKGRLEQVFNCSEKKNVNCG